MIDSLVHDRRPRPTQKPSAPTAVAAVAQPTARHRPKTQRPPSLLRRFVQSIMRQREQRGTGWSRPWNKAGMTVFQVHAHDPSGDESYFQMLLPLLDRALVRASPAYRDFVVELLQDPSLVAFTYYHNREDEGRQYEGLTLSLGRVVPKEPSKRDRVDIVLEDQREHGAVDGLVDSVRVYVCPWFTYGHNRNFHLSQGFATRGDAFRVVQEVYQRCVSRFHAWRHQADRQATHWSNRYIEHFGPRQFVPQGSSFT